MSTVINVRYNRVSVRYKQEKNYDKLTRTNQPSAFVRYKLEFVITEFVITELDCMFYIFCLPKEDPELLEMDQMEPKTETSGDEGTLTGTKSCIEG